MRKAMVAGVLGLLALPALAMAQDGSEVAASRTPANAQKFLTSLPPEFFSNGKAFLIREQELASPDICRTTMSGLIAVHDGTRYVVERTKKVTKSGIYMQLNGLTVTASHRGYAAHQAGLRIGDVIISVDGKRLGSRDDFNVALADRAATGGAAQIVFARGGVENSVAVTPVLDASSGLIDVPIPPKPPVEMVIDWSKVEQVMATGQSPHFGIELKTPSETQSSVKALYYPVANTRDRALAAAQYLQTACDQTKELGF